MEVDETMFPGQFHHPRFIGERGGRQQQCLVGENSVRSTGWSTGSLAENAAGRVAKLHFARACGMRSSKRSPLYSRLSCPSSRRKRSRVSPCRKSLGFWVAKWSRFAPLFSKKGLLWGRSGARIREKLTLVLFLVPTRVLFHARSRFERRNPRLERRCLDPFVTGVPP